MRCGYEPEPPPGRGPEGAPVLLGRRPPMPGGGGMGRPLGPIGGRGPGGGGTGLPDGPSGGRFRRWSGGAVGAAVSGACAAGAWAAGAWAAGDWAGVVEGAPPGAAGAVGDGRLLVTRRGGRAGASAPPPAPAPAPPPAPALAPADAAAGALSDGAATLRAGACLAGALVAPALDAATAFLAGASAVAVAAAPSAAAGAGAAVVVPAAFLAGAAFLVALAAFLAGAGSSGWTGRRRPSASALRRTRSACASSMEDEWLLTPIPRERASSSPSLLVRPSSLASS